MDKTKLERILSKMKEQGMTQMIISDSPAIFYLTGKWIHPGERLLALYLNVNGSHKLVINKLFPQEQDLGVELVWYDDVEDAVEILSGIVEHDKPIGIDKTHGKIFAKIAGIGGWKPIFKWFVDCRFYTND